MIIRNTILEIERSTYLGTHITRGLDSRRSNALRRRHELDIMVIIQLIIIIILISYSFAEDGVADQIIVLVVTEHGLGLETSAAHHPHRRLGVLA